MAFPQVRSSTSSREDVTTTSHGVDLPATVVAGDLLVAVVVTDGSPDFTWPMGWTEVFAADANSALARMEVRQLTATGSEGGTSITVTTSGSEISSHATFAISGAHASTPPEAATAATAFSASPNPGNLAPSWGAEDTLFLAVCSYDNGTRTISGYPTNYTNGTNVVNTGEAQGCGLGHARRELNASSDNPSAFTLDTSDDWVSTVIAIRPAVVAATGESRRQRIRRVLPAIYQQAI